MGNWSIKTSFIYHTENTIPFAREEMSWGGEKSLESRRYRDIDYQLWMHFILNAKNTGKNDQNLFKIRLYSLQKGDGGGEKPW